MEHHSDGGDIGLSNTPPPPALVINTINSKLKPYPNLSPRAQLGFPHFAPGPPSARALSSAPPTRSSSPFTLETKALRAVSLDSRSNSTHSQNQPLKRSFRLPKTELDEVTLKRFRRWVLAIAIVEFDLDMGPDLDNIYPDLPLSPTLRSNIAFSSLPEGDMPTAGAHMFSWRIPIPTTAPVLESPVLHQEPEEQLEELGVPPQRRESYFVPEGDGFYYGFVYFVQEKNDSLRRGYSQRSLVLISHLPHLVGLFSNILSILGPMHFKHAGEGSMIETACHNIASWPDPTGGTTIELPFLGSVHTYDFPVEGQPQWGTLSKPNQPQPIPVSLPTTPLSTLFHAGILTFSKILLLWELVLLGEPILIFSKDPRTGSELVNHLTNFIRPIIFGADFRPYYHIHDHDFRQISRPSPHRPPPGLIVSGTNPLLLTTLKHWPNILRISNGGGLMKLDTGPVGLTSERKRHVKKDASVAKAVEKAFASGDYITCDAFILRHLTTLTEQFLAPLNRYFGTLPSISTSLSNPQPTQSFSPTSFLASLKSHGTSLQFRTSTSSLSTSSSTTMERFYLRFLSTRNFGLWLQRRSEVAEGEVRKRYLDRLEGTEMGAWMSGKEDGEVDELVGRLEREAVLEERAERRASSLLSVQRLSTSVRDGPPPSSSSPDRMRSVKLRKQVERLKELRDERSERSSTSGAESD
ncbi:DUF1630-domain-containing protein [Meredithblackwellia eburnea MCA 4105]